MKYSKVIKNRLSKLLVLVLIGIMILTSFFALLGDEGGGNTTGGSSSDASGNGSQGGVIQAPGQLSIGDPMGRGTKISFIIEEAGKDADTGRPNEWYSLGKIVDGGMPISDVGVVPHPWSGGGPRAKYPLYFLDGTQSSTLNREIVTIDATSVEYRTVNNFQYWHSTWAAEVAGEPPEAKVERERIMGDYVRAFWTVSWFTGTASGDNMTEIFSWDRGSDLVTARNAVFDNPGDPEKVKEFYLEAYDNIVFTSTILRSTRNAGHSGTDLDNAIAVYDYMFMRALEAKGIGAAGVAADRMTVPDTTLEVAVIIEPLVAVGPSGSIEKGLSTIRTFEAAVMGGNRGTGSSRALLEGHTAPTWAQNISGVMVGMNYRWLAGSTNQANTAKSSIGANIYYSGPIPPSGTEEADLDDFYLGFGSVYAPRLTENGIPPTITAVTLVNVHEYGKMVDGEFVVDDELTHHEIIPIMDNTVDIGAWYNPAIGRDIPAGSPSLISRKDLVEGASAAERRKNKDGVEEVADFGTADLREWWITTNTVGETGYHSHRGTADTEIDMKMSGGGDDRGTRNTSYPVPTEGRNWFWQHNSDAPATPWTGSLEDKIQAYKEQGEKFTEDQEPFEIPILVEVFEEDETVPPDAITNQVIYLRYQHDLSEFIRIIILRTLKTDGTFTDELYPLPEGRKMLPIDEVHTYVPPYPLELKEWYVTDELPDIPGPTWDDVNSFNEIVPMNTEPVVVDPEEVFEDTSGGVLYILVEMPATEWHEVIIKRTVDETTGAVISEELARAREIPENEFVGGVYTYTNPLIHQWYATKVLPRTDGPTWGNVSGYPANIHPMVGPAAGSGPAILDTNGQGPPGGVLYVLLVEEIPTEEIEDPTRLQIELTEQRITRTFSLIDIINSSLNPTATLENSWLPSESWLLRPSLREAEATASNQYAFDFVEIDHDCPIESGCHPPSPNHATRPSDRWEYLTSYVRKAQFRSSKWVDPTYLVEHMNRNFVDGYVIGSVEYADGGRWGIQMAENRATDTASRIDWTSVLTDFLSGSTSPAHYSQGTSDGGNFFRRLGRVSGSPGPSGGRFYRPQDTNAQQGNPTHPTHSNRLVPRYYFTVYRKNNLPMISHWAYEVDAKERLDIEDFKSEVTDRNHFHVLQDGIDDTRKVGGKDQSARSVWWEDRASEKLLDSRSDGIPKPTYESRIGGRGINPRNGVGHRSYLTDPDHIFFRFTNDVDPAMPASSEVWRSGDPGRYSPSSDDRVMFEWFVISEHWHIASWTNGPNGSGGIDPVPNGPSDVQGGWEVITTGVNSVQCCTTTYTVSVPDGTDEDGNTTYTTEERTRLNYSSTTCNKTWNYKTNWAMVVGSVVSGGGPSRPAHEYIFENSGPNQSNNQAYVQWMTFTEQSAWNTPASPVNYEGMSHAGGGRQRLNVPGLKGPGNSPIRPSGSNQDGGDDGRTLRYGIIQERAVLSTAVLEYMFQMRVYRYESTPNTGSQTPTVPGSSSWIGTDFQAFNTRPGQNPWAQAATESTGSKRVWAYTPVTQPFKFYTYIAMVYDDVQDDQSFEGFQDEIFVLSESESTLYLFDSVELAWSNNKPEESIRFESNQWSGHARVSWLKLRALGSTTTQNPTGIPATDLQGSMSQAYANMDKFVLPGGALFKTLHQENNFVTMGLRTWITFIQDDIREYLGPWMPDIGRANMDLAGAVAHHRSLVGNYTPGTSGATGLINQSGSRYVSLFVNGRKVGPNVSGPDSSNASLESGILNSASRYWRSFTLDADDQRSSRVRPVDKVENHTAFRMVARVDGTVSLERQDLGANPSGDAGTGFGSDDWIHVQTWDKEFGADLETGQRASLSGLAKQIDDNTGLISGFFQALNRNQGRDDSVDVDYGPEWYNQAFRGFGVIVSESMWRYNLWDSNAGSNPGTGFNNPGGITVTIPQTEGGYRMQALDPKLTPLNKYGQNGMFTRLFYADARVNAFRYRIGGNSDGGWRSASVEQFGRDGRNKVGLELNDNYVNANSEFGLMLQGNAPKDNHRFFIPNATVQDLR